MEEDDKTTQTTWISWKNCARLQFTFPSQSQTARYLQVWKCNECIFAQRWHPLRAKDDFLATFSKLVRKPTKTQQKKQRKKLSD